MWFARGRKRQKTAPPTLVDVALILAPFLDIETLLALIISSRTLSLTRDARSGINMLFTGDMVRLHPHGLYDSRLRYNGWADSLLDDILDTSDGDTIVTLMELGFKPYRATIPSLSKHTHFSDLVRLLCKAQKLFTLEVLRRQAHADAFWMACVAVLDHSLGSKALLYYSLMRRQMPVSRATLDIGNVFLGTNFEAIPQTNKSEIQLLLICLYHGDSPLVLSNVSSVMFMECIQSITDVEGLHVLFEIFTLLRPVEQYSSMFENYCHCIYASQCISVVSMERCLMNLALYGSRENVDSGAIGMFLRSASRFFGKRIFSAPAINECISRYVENGFNNRNTLASDERVICSLFNSKCFSRGIASVQYKHLMSDCNDLCDVVICIGQSSYMLDGYLLHYTTASGVDDINRFKRVLFSGYCSPGAMLEALIISVKAADVAKIRLLARMCEQLDYIEYLYSTFCEYWNSSEFQYSILHPSISNQRCIRRIGELDFHQSPRETRQIIESNIDASLPLFSVDTMLFSRFQCGCDVCLEIFTVLLGAQGASTRALDELLLLHTDTRMDFFSVIHGYRFSYYGLCLAAEDPLSVGYDLAKELLSSYTFDPYEFQI